MADVKWIKITTDIFDDEKILLIESLPDSYAIITCWFKLLCLAGKQNNNGVFLMGRIAYTENMLATIFRMKETTVTMALQTFEQFGMIETVDGVITIPNWNKHQTLDVYERKKERDRLYQAERRANQRALVAKSSDNRSTVERQSNDESPLVVVSDKEEDKDKEEDRDEEIYISIVAHLNQRVGTNYRASSKKTKSCIHARLEEGFKVEDFKTVIDKKADEWMGTEYEQYLRPETLFGTKFESYLNARVRKSAVRQQQDQQTRRGGNVFLDLIDEEG